MGITFTFPSNSIYIYIYIYIWCTNNIAFRSLLKLSDIYIYILINLMKSNKYNDYLH